MIRLRHVLLVTGAVAFGLLVAGATTKLQYGCQPEDGAVGCISFEKAIMRPSDLLHNVQGSLTTFLVTLGLASLACFAVLFWIDWSRQKK